MTRLINRQLAFGVVGSLSDHDLPAGCFLFRLAIGDTMHDMLIEHDVDLSWS